MADVRVLVVDDSAAMRALFSDILEQAKGVEVVGTARGADEARDMIPECKPDVLTLDVEMPGMTGVEFLEELMATNPMPVIMLSSVTQQGTGTAEKALKLGAVDCFPKPLHTSPEEFAATVAKLGEIVIAAAQTDVSAREAGGEAGGADYAPDGRIVVVAAGTHDLEAVRQTIAAYPENCPPTVFLIDAEEDQVERAVDRLRPSVPCKIAEVEGEEMLAAGTVYLAFRKDKHVVIEDDFAPVVKAVARDPIAGRRPSADMLIASLARSGLPAVGGLLADIGEDGVKGLEMLAKTGATTFIDAGAQQAQSVRAASGSTELVEASKLPAWIMSSTAKA